MKKWLKSMFTRKPRAKADPAKRDDRFGVWRNLHPTKGWRIGEPRSKKAIGLQLNNGDYIDLREERKAARA